jgi:F-type H+-transporting ATPase subunit b
VLIDWFTVCAQIVNFVILVALMKRFLYGPLVKAIDAREQRIAAQLADADGKSKQAELETEQVRQKISELESRCTQMIAEARNEADRKKNEMVATARDSVRAQEQRWREDLRLEQSTFFSEVRRTAAGEILTITRRVLADLAGADIERSAVDVFLEKLRSFDGETLKKLSGGALTVVSARELPAELQHRIEETIGKCVGNPVPLRFEHTPDLAWGIELRGDGQRIGWTPGGYLDALEEKLKSELDQRAELRAPLAVE